MKDPKGIISPRLAAAIIFTLFALVFFFFTKYTLVSLKDSALLPFWRGILITLLLSLLLGFLFGQRLGQPKHWLTCFLLGVLMAFLALVMLSFLLVINHINDPHLTLHFPGKKDYFIFYGAILLSLILTLGVWLMPLFGLVALYFNKRFWPKFITNYQHRNYQHRK